MLRKIRTVQAGWAWISIATAHSHQTLERSLGPNGEIWRQRKPSLAKQYLVTSIVYFSVIFTTFNWRVLVKPSSASVNPGLAREAAHGQTSSAWGRGSQPPTSGQSSHPFQLSAVDETLCLDARSGFPLIFSRAFVQSRVCSWPGTRRSWRALSNGLEQRIACPLHWLRFGRRVASENGSHLAFPAYRFLVTLVDSLARRSQTRNVPNQLTKQRCRAQSNFLQRIDHSQTSRGGRTPLLVALARCLSGAADQLLIRQKAAQFHPRWCEDISLFIFCGAQIESQSVHVALPDFVCCRYACSGIVVITAAVSQPRMPLGRMKRFPFPMPASAQSIPVSGILGVTNTQNTKIKWVFCYSAQAFARRRCDETPYKGPEKQRRETRGWDKGLPPTQTDATALP